MKLGKVKGNAEIPFPRASEYLLVPQKSDSVLLSSLRTQGLPVFLEAVPWTSSRVTGVSFVLCFPCWVISSSQGSFIKYHSSLFDQIAENLKYYSFQKGRPFLKSGGNKTKWIKIFYPFTIKFYPRGRLDLAHIHAEPGLSLFKQNRKKKVQRTCLKANRVVFVHPHTSVRLGGQLRREVF